MSIRTSLALMLFVTAAAAGDPPKSPDCATTTRIELRYSPGGDCTKAIVYEIDNARSKVLVLAYSFTSEPITQALIRAKNRGLEVQAVIDSARLFERSNSTKALVDNRIDVYGDTVHAIQHQKVIIIDSDKEDPTLILGSFNFTAAAETSNSEVICILRSREMAVAAERNWIMHKKHSRVFAEFSPPEKHGFLANIKYYLLLTGLAFGALIVGMIFMYLLLFRKSR